jgi:hypothetical protein
LFYINDYYLFLGKGFHGGAQELSPDVAFAILGNASTLLDFTDGVLRAAVDVVRAADGVVEGAASPFALFLSLAAGLAR